MKTVIRHLLTFLIICWCPETLAQPDTIIVYDVPTQTIDTILPVSFDTAITFDNTLSSIGSLGSQVPLSLTPPAVNLFSSSNFSDIEKAELSYNVTDYPIRTSIKLFGWNNDTLGQGCSAIMVGENLVLTAAHCIMLFQNWLYDSMLVVPAYDNGIYQLTLPTSIVDKYYIFKTFYDGTAWEDIALLQLRQPIGQQIGWIGMAYSSDTSYFSNKVFHKFSYPAVVSPFDSTKVYNGDTLYYNYGYIDILSPNNLGVNSPEASGIPGQSGSSLFYTDNLEYYSFGVFSWSTYYRHHTITNEIFYALKNVMDNYAVSISGNQPNSNNTIVYPNPFSDFTTLEFEYLKNKNYALAIYSAIGQLVRTVDDITTGRVKIERKNLASGLYFFQLRNNRQVVAIGKLIIE